MKRGPYRTTQFLAGLGPFLFLAAITLAVFWPIGSYQFVNYDDYTYVTQNSQVQDGLTWEGVKWAFSTFHGSNWHPFTWLSHMSDVEFFGMEPMGHHLVSLLIHLVNVLLLYVIFWKTTGARWRSTAVAALFAVHPLHVESVAWIAERKDVLSATFWLLAMIIYSWYARRPGIGRYLLLTALFVLGLMTKPMLITLPFILLLMDFWPLRRWNLQAGKNDFPGLMRLHRFPPQLLYEKIPLFLLSAASSVVTVTAQRSGGAIKSMEIFPVGMRIQNAVISYVLYIYKMIWPQKMAVFYPYPTGGTPWWMTSGAGLILVLVTAAAIRDANKRPYLFTGWFWYLLTLLPVIGLVQVGMQAMADRYTYIPLIGLFTVISWGAYHQAKRWKHGTRVVTIAILVVLIVLSLAAAKQVRYWRNSTDLFRHALEVTEENFTAHNNLGIVLARQGEYEEAIYHYKEAIRIKPDDFQAHNNLGGALDKQGDHISAIRHYLESLRINPDDPVTHYNLGLSLLDTGNYADAASHLDEALRKRPGFAEAFFARGLAAVRQHNDTEGIFFYRRALEHRPGYPEAWHNLGSALARQGRYNEAGQCYKTALKFRPDYPMARKNLQLVITRMEQQKVSSLDEPDEQDLNSQEPGD